MPADVLYHFSEDPAIRVFRPHFAPTAALPDPLVWAIDGEHAPLYWFPRACPRVTFWAIETTTLEDRARFLADTTAGRVHAIEAAWLDPMRACELYVYRFPGDRFELLDANGGFWVARHEVVPLDVAPVGDLLRRHAGAGMELRITPSLWPLADAVAASTLGFSLVRMGNAAPRRDGGFSTEGTAQ